MCELFGLSVWCVKGWSDAGSIATIFTVLGLIAVFLQIRQQSATARATFENLFVEQYHALIQRLPAKALLGELLSVDERQRTLSEFYHYVDLCNTQVYHHRQRRISDDTWAEWSDGIEHNLGRPEFAAAWSYIAERSPDDFDDLRGRFQPRTYDPGEPYL